MRAKAPNGLWIIGTADVIEGTALLHGFTRDADGRLNPDYDGETKVHWDSQTTKTGESKLPMYVDSDYNEWEEDRLILVEDGEEGGTYHLVFKAFVGAWMDRRRVQPATLMAYPTRQAAWEAGNRVKSRNSATVEGFEITFHPEVAHG